MNTLSQFPNQAIPIRKKNTQWRKDCIDAAYSQTSGYISYIRKNRKEKALLYDLWNGRVDVEDMRILLSAHNLFFQEELEEIAHFPIAVPHINVLLGEEQQRSLDYRISVTNPSAISEMEKIKNEEANSMLEGILTSDYGGNQELLQKKLQEYTEYYSYTYQDKREQRDNWILNHYIHELDVKTILDDGYKDLLISGEEIYLQDIVQDEPVVMKLNPLKIQTVQSGSSKYIEDASIVVYRDYWSPSKIIDYFYDELSQNDIKNIDKIKFNGGNMSDNMDNDMPATIIDFSTEKETTYGDVVNMIGGTNSTTVNLYGDIRITWVFWKSKRLILKVKYFDNKGNTQYDYYPEDYIVNKELGEEAKAVYINEAWEGIKIGKDIYVRMGPRKIQYNRMSNPSRCHFGISGIIDSTNETKAKSLFEMTKTYQYMYDIIHHKLNDAVAHDFGSIMELDFAKVPAGWEIEKWLWFAIKNKIAVTDSFKPALEGPAAGKLAGFMNTTGKPLNFSQGNFIQYNIELLQFIKSELSSITGITPQRLGSVDSRETVGGIERSVRQSTYSTEYYVKLHHKAIRNFLTIFLETIKISLRNNKKKLNYISDDGVNVIFDVDTDYFSETDHGLMIEDSLKTEALEQKLDLLMHASMQTQEISIADAVKYYNASSTLSRQKILEKGTERKIQQQQQQFESSEKRAKETEEAKINIIKLQEDYGDKRNIRDNETKVKVKLLELQSQLNTNNDVYDSDGILSEKEYNLNRDKLKNDLEKFYQTLDLKKDELTETTRHNKSMESKQSNIKK